METTNATKITVETNINAPVEKVWNTWTEPAHIMNWCYASDDWHAPAATNDMRTGGRFSTTMAAKNGTAAFDFAGEYTNVIPLQLIEYTMEDGRQVKIVFQEVAGKTTVTESFDAETTHAAEMQKAGWQAILENFKKYTEESA